MLTQPTCSVDGCERLPHRRGWCTTHYGRWQKHKDPLFGDERLRLARRSKTCNADGCERPTVARGWCFKHYERYMKHGSPDARPRPEAKKCGVENCENQATRRGWCQSHYRRWRRYGDPLLGKWDEALTPGTRFGMLEVIEFLGKRSGSRWYLCRCDCGQTKVRSYVHLKDVKSCGCLRGRSGRGQWPPQRPGSSRHPMYARWRGIIGRCRNPNHHAFRDYGGRGIDLYPGWFDSFTDFADYVSALPHYREPGRTLDRINNDGNYEPGNLRWSTHIEQIHNRRPISTWLGNDIRVHAAQASEGRRS